MKLSIDPQMIRKLLRDSGKSYADIELESSGEIDVNTLKYSLNTKKPSMSDKKIEHLAEILGCDPNDLLNKETRISSNLPYEIKTLVSDLFDRKRGRIQTIYRKTMEEFVSHPSIKEILNEGNELFMLMAGKDDVYDKENILRIYRHIFEKFNAGATYCSSSITGLNYQDIKSIFDHFSIPNDHYNPNQTFFVFVYATILFDAIIQIEAAASVAQLIPQRTTDRADEYFELTKRTEEMRNTLKNLILHRGYRFDSPEIENFDLDELLMQGIVLMLATIHECKKHLEGIYVDSEYMRNDILAAISRFLEKIFDNLGIAIETRNSFDMITSRFGQYYSSMKSMNNLINPPAKRVDKYSQGCRDMFFCVNTFSSS
jgi:hypothetical protein